MTPASAATEEILDIVNEQDEIVGSAPRSVANHNPKFIHREIGILVHDKENHILLQQRSQKKTNPGLWIMSVAGHVTSGLTYEQAAHKELLEELGFDTELTLISKELYRLPSETAFCSLFAAFYSDQKIIVDPGETQQIRFFSPSEFEAFFQADNQIEEFSAKDVQAFWKSNP